jgi:hypothetical protein
MKEAVSPSGRSPSMLMISTRCAFGDGEGEGAGVCVTADATVGEMIGVMLAADVSASVGVSAGAAGRQDDRSRARRSAGSRWNLFIRVFPPRSWVRDPCLFLSRRGAGILAQSPEPD